MKIEEMLKGNRAVVQIFIIYEKVYGLKKAREMFDYLIEQLVEIFKSYARSLVPEKKKVEDVGIELLDLIEPVYLKIYLKDIWNSCRQEMLRGIEEG